MTGKAGVTWPLMRLLTIAAALWIAGNLVGQWQTIHAAWQLLAIDLGPRPALADADRALLTIRCTNLPSARERARCALDQSAARRPLELWDAASTDLAQRHTEARHTLVFILAIALLPPAALLLTGWGLERFLSSSETKPEES